MNYKIYKRNNQVFIDDIATQDRYSGVIGFIEIVKNPLNTSYFKFSGFIGFPVTDILLQNIFKENGTGYTVNEWETFYTSLSQELTVSFPAPVGGATEAKQDTGNATLTAINDKTPSLGNFNAAGSTPVSQSVETASGTISTQNLVPLGVPTANSAVEIDLKGASQIGIQVVGTYTGALSLQYTINGINWITSTSSSGLIDQITGASSITIATAAQGLFKAECAGMAKARITALAAVTGTANISLRTVPVNSMVGLSRSLPSGSNVIGDIGNSGTPTAPATPYFVNSLATTNGALVLTGTSGLHAFYATNIGATVAFVKLYNKATAPTVGTNVPEMVITVPAAVGGVPGTATLPIGTNGFRFALGLGIAITGGMADNDTTAVAAGQVKVKLSRTV